MDGVNFRGIENAMNVIENNPGKGTKGDKFSEVFALENGSEIRTFGDFFAWKIEQITKKLRKLLAELKALMAQFRRDIEAGTYDSQALAAKASKELKTYAIDNGVVLDTASPEELLEMIKQLEEEIIAMGKRFAVGSVKDNAAEGGTKGIADVSAWGRPAAEEEITTD